MSSSVASDVQFLHVGGSDPRVSGRLAIAAALCFNSLLSPDHHTMILYTRDFQPFPDLVPHPPFVIDLRAAGL
jgi:hypothetical protein